MGHGACGGGEDKLKELVLSFPYVNSKDWSQFIRFGGKHFDLLSHLTNSVLGFSYHDEFTDISLVFFQVVN